MRFAIECDSSYEKVNTSGASLGCLSSSVLFVTKKNQKVSLSDCSRISHAQVLHCKNEFLHMLHRIFADIPHLVAETVRKQSREIS